MGAGFNAARRAAPESAMTTLPVWFGPEKGHLRGQLPEHPLVSFRLTVDGH